MKEYAAIDIGATRIKYGIVDGAGRVTPCGETDTGIEKGGRALQDKIIGVLRGLVSDYDVRGIGLCSPGIINHKERRVGYAPHIAGWDEIYQADELERIFRVPVCVENDVKAAALAESAFGAGKNYDSFYMITFGTYLGGALVMNKQLCRGAHGIAGELAFMKSTGEACRASAHTLTTIAGQRLGMPQITGVEFFEKYREGDDRCAEILSDWCAMTAPPLADVLCVVDPQALVIGGGISRAADIVLPQLKKALSEYFELLPLTNLEVVAAAFGNEAGMVGAVAALTGMAK